MSNNENTPTPRFTGIFIPAEILDHYDLSSTDMMLLSWIDALQCPKRGGCFASNEYFAKKLKLKENTVKILISKLVKLDLIERVSFDGRNRILRSCKEKWYGKSESQSTAEVEKNQPQRLKKINPCPSLKSTPSYIYSKEERKVLEPPPPDLLKSKPDQKENGGGGGGFESQGIKYINMRGKESFVDETEIYQYFLKKEYPTEIIKKAISEAKKNEHQISNILSWLETVCKRLYTQVVTKKENKVTVFEFQKIEKTIAKGVKQKNWDIKT